MSQSEDWIGLIDNSTVCPLFLILLAATCELLPPADQPGKLCVNSALPVIAADSVHSGEELLQGSLPSKFRPAPLYRTSALAGTGSLGLWSNQLKQTAPAGFTLLRLLPRMLPGHLSSLIKSRKGLVLWNPDIQNLGQDCSCFCHLHSDLWI